MNTITRRTRVAKSTAPNAYKLLDDVARTITEDPKRVDMRYWLLRSSDIRCMLDPKTAKKRMPSCGSIGCIAGWTVMLAAGQDTKIDNLSFDVKNSAAQILGFLKEDEALMDFFQGDLVFLNNSGTRAYARKVVKHIRVFQNLFETRLKAKAL